MEALSRRRQSHDVSGWKHTCNIPRLQISNLKENVVYQFQVAAMNLAGLGAPSAVSQSFKCEEWTIAVPGEWGRPPAGLGAPTAPPLQLE